MLDGRGISYEANSDGERTIQLNPEASMGDDRIELVQQNGANQQCFSDASAFQDFMNPAKVTLEPGQDVAIEHEETPAEIIQPVAPEPFAADAAQPGEGYISIEDEVADLAFKIERMRKKGIKVRTFAGTAGELREMRAEFNRVRSEIEFENSLKFGKKALCGVVSVIEWLNQKYQPFDLQLEGWSESVMTSIDSYEGTLERLINKYRNRVSTPPEVELALSLAASGLMYHMTNTMFRQALLPGGAGANPDLIKSVMGAFSGARPQAPPAAPAAPSQAPAAAATKPYQMKGPGIDLGPILRSMPTPMPYPKPANPPDPSRLHQQVPTPPPPPQPPAAPPVVATPPAAQSAVTMLDEAGENDRLSDIDSEDLNSVRSVDLESLAGSLCGESQQREVLNFNIPAPSKQANRPRPRSKAPRSRKPANSSIKTFDI